MIDSLYYSSRNNPEVWKLFCELQNKLPKALLFITKDLNSASESVQIHVYRNSQTKRKSATWVFVILPLEFL